MAKKKVVTVKKQSPQAPKKVNKSQLVRDYAAKHPSAKPKEIEAALAKEDGVKIPAAQISSILWQKANKKGKKTAKKKTRPRPSSSIQNISLEALLDAKNFADKVGGVEDAQQLLQALNKLS